MTSMPRSVSVLIAVLLASFALAACSPSAMAGGFTGGALGLFVLGMLLAGSLTTQTGCDKNPIHVGPCLSIAPPEYFDDQGNYTGPPDPPEQDMSAAGQDMNKPVATEEDMGGDMPDKLVKPPPVQPCLSIAPPKEPKVGPCLSPARPRNFDEPPEALNLQLPSGDQTPQHASPSEQKLALLDKLADRLPADVVAKLQGEHQNKEDQG